MERWLQWRIPGKIPEFASRTTAEDARCSVDGLNSGNTDPPAGQWENPKATEREIAHRKGNDQLES